MLSLMHPGSICMRALHLKVRLTGLIYYVGASAPNARRVTAIRERNDVIQGLSVLILNC